MNGFDGDWPEMTRDGLDDHDVEGLLAGRITPPGWGAVAACAADARAAGRGPLPVPSAALRTMLVDGLAPPAGAAPAAGRAGSRHDSAAVVSTAAPGGGRAGSRPDRAAQVAVRRVGRTRRVAVAELLAGLGVASKVLLGAAVASATVTAAGVAGVLPDPVQDATERVVRAATPFQLSDETDVEPAGSGNDVDHAPAGTGGDDPGATGATGPSGPSGPGVDGSTVTNMAQALRPEPPVAPPSTAPPVPGSNQELGSTVSADATDPDDPGVDGSTVSSLAHGQGLGSDVAGDIPAHPDVPPTGPSPSSSGSTVSSQPGGAGERPTGVGTTPAPPSTTPAPPSTTPAPPSTTPAPPSTTPGTGARPEPPTGGDRTAGRGGS